MLGARRFMSARNQCLDNHCQHDHHDREMKNSHRAPKPLPTDEKRSNKAEAGWLSWSPPDNPIAVVVTKRLDDLEFCTANFEDTEVVSIGFRRKQSSNGPKDRDSRDLADDTFRFATAEKEVRDLESNQLAIIITEVSCFHQYRMPVSPLRRLTASSAGPTARVLRGRWRLGCLRRLRRAAKMTAVGVRCSAC
jgi:hypothetical protein